MNLHLNKLMTFAKWLSARTTQLTCHHVYKEIETEFLEHRTVLTHGKHLTELGFYARHAYHMNCIKCGNHKIQVHDKLVNKVNLDDEVTRWVAQSNESIHDIRSKLMMGDKS